MCGGGGDQTVTQKTELDPALQRLLYGGTIADPRGGFGGGSGGSGGGGGFGGGGDYGGNYAGAYGGNADAGVGYGEVGDPMGDIGYGGDYGAAGDVSGGIAGDYGAPDGHGDYGGENGFGGGVYADGGLVQRYNMGGQVQPQGLAALNQGQMPMMGGQLPNLSDPMTAATLAMAVRQPEMQYGSIMAQPDPMTMQPQMMQPQQRYVEGGYVEGPGSGRSDDVEAQIYQGGVPVQEARLSDGEFVMTERAVRGAGDGDREEGAAKMYRMMQEFERGGYV